MRAAVPVNMWVMGAEAWTSSITHPLTGMYQKGSQVTLALTLLIPPCSDGPCTLSS